MSRTTHVSWLIMFLVGLLVSLIGTSIVMGNPETWHVIPSGGPFDQVEAFITKTDMVTNTGCWVIFKVEIVPTAPHYGMGIVFSTSRTTIGFQVWYKEYDATDYGWHYMEYGTGWGSKPEVHLPYLGITATGDHTGKVFTVKVPVSLLGGCDEEFYFAIQFRTNLLGTLPQGLNLWAQTDASLFLSTRTPVCPVGGVWVPINKFELLAPWIGLASFLAVTTLAVSVVFVKRRKNRNL